MTLLARDSNNCQVAVTVVYMSTKTGSIHVETASLLALFLHCGFCRDSFRDGIIFILGQSEFLFIES